MAKLSKMLKVVDVALLCSYHLRCPNKSGDSTEASTSYFSEKLDMKFSGTILW